MTPIDLPANTEKLKAASVIHREKYIRLAQMQVDATAFYVLKKDLF